MMGQRLAKGRHIRVKMKEKMHKILMAHVGVQIDDSMMSELKEVQQAIQPSDTLLVVDAMTGQEAAGLVRAFNDTAPLTGTPQAGPAAVNRPFDWQPSAPFLPTTNQKIAGTSHPAPAQRFRPG